MNGSSETAKDRLFRALDEFDPDEPQIAVMLIAWQKYVERSRLYAADDPYGNGGWRAQLVEMRKRIDRLWVRYFNQDSDFTPAVDYIEDLDDAYDLINFVVFFVRLVEKGNRDGEWPWPGKM